MNRRGRLEPASASMILASASPRRAELLKNAGIRFQAVVSPITEPERKPGSIPFHLWPMCLAYLKATAVQHILPPKDRGKLVLAADTIVLDRRRLLNKARNRAHARRMLKSLQGKTHLVITGIALLQGQRIRLASASAVCRIRKKPAAWLEEYLDSGLWKGKAGAYGIQDPGDPFVELLSGDITTVIGLPMPLLLSELASFQRDRI